MCVRGRCEVFISSSLECPWANLNEESWCGNYWNTQLMLCTLVLMLRVPECKFSVHKSHNFPENIHGQVIVLGPALLNGEINPLPLAMIVKLLMAVIILIWSWNKYISWFYLSTQLSYLVNKFSISVRHERRGFFICIVECGGFFYLSGIRCLTWAYYLLQFISTYNIHITA